MQCQNDQRLFSLVCQRTRCIFIKAIGLYISTSSWQWKPLESAQQVISQLRLYTTVQVYSNLMMNQKKHEFLASSFNILSTEINKALLKEKFWI